MTNPSFYDEDYYERGKCSGKSLYENYRWLPDLTLPLAKQIIKEIEISSGGQNLHREIKILDFGCAKGYLVQALRELGYDSYGIDVSEYAISQANVETRIYLEVSNNELQIPSYWPSFDWVIAKDVLEHIEYNSLPRILERLRSLANNILVVVPLGDGKNYFIPDYELDKSHYIKEDLTWWEDILNKSGFRVQGTYNVGLLKQTWSDMHPKGNGLLISTPQEIA